MLEIAKPLERSSLRTLLGKEYYISRRKLARIFGKKRWASERGELLSQHRVFKHQSMILRPLKDVEMYLQENKRTNLKLAVSHIHNLVIRPGETFSIWRLVGRPTKKKGYLEGLVLNQGKIDKGIGGGLCQLGNLLFWLFAHSPLSIEERYRHGVDVFPDVNRKVPFGAGAPLSYNHIDLQVKNNTARTFQLNVWLDDTYLHGELLVDQALTDEFRVEERNHIIKQQIWGGYSRHNQIVQVISHEDGMEEERMLVENHAIMMYNPFIESK